jgi:hypothetical protein
MTFLELSPYLVAGTILAVAAWLIIRGLRRFFRGESGCSGCSSQRFVMRAVTRLSRHPAPVAADAHPPADVRLSKTTGQPVEQRKVRKPLTGKPYSPAVEDYLEAILSLEGENRSVRSIDLSRHLNVPVRPSAKR